MFKFIHAADLHLDSPLIGLERYEGAPVDRIRGATREALKNLVSLALSEAVAFVLIAGDLFDGDWKDYNTGLFFADQMRRLREASIPVFLVSGNHDAASQISKTLKMPENVHRFSVKRAQTITLDLPGVAIHGQGFARAAVTTDLASDYPAAMPGCFNIGLLHTSATGRPGHEPYAPCTLEGLIAKGYDYWALGHVHKREILSVEPRILFSGNTQGRNIRETGPKGCTLVTVENDRILSSDAVDLDVVRWASREITLEEARDADDILERIAVTIRAEKTLHGDRLLAMRFLLTGSCSPSLARAVHSDQFVNEVRSLGTDVGGGDVWVEKVNVHPRLAADLETLIERDDPLGGLLRSIRDLSPSTDALEPLLAELADLKKRIPHELLHGDEPLDIDVHDRRPEILEDVKQLLVARLIAGGR
ncbi:MAG: exonuclease SbcCD subunit D [Syntrophobacteraceae bacterium]